MMHVDNLLSSSAQGSNDHNGREGLSGIIGGLFY
jgi:hypothetical protein